MPGKRSWETLMPTGGSSSGSGISSVARNYSPAMSQARERPGCEHEQRWKRKVTEDPANAQCVMQLARIYAGLGEKAAALREGERALQLLGPVDPVQRILLETVFAQLSAGVGEKDRAMNILERLVTVPSGPTLAELRLHPDWDQLREHPRFQKLLAGPEPKTIY